MIDLRPAVSLTLGAVLLVVLSTAPARSATGFALADADARAVDEAVARNDLALLYKAMFGAIAAAPDRVPETVAAIVARAPDHRAALVGTASAAFPDYAERLAAAGGDGAVADDEISPWSLEAELGGLYQTGNSPRDSITTAGTLGYDSGNWHNAFGIAFDFVNDSGETTTRRFVAHNRTRYDLAERWFATARLRFVDDKDDGFQWQTQELFGPGYRILDGDTLTLTVEGGPGFRQVRERSEDGGHVNNDLVGWAGADFAWQIGEGARFTNTVAATGDPDRAQIDNTAALTLRIVDNLAARLSYEVRHDTDPGEDAGKTDGIARATLVYRFGRNSE
ncbi:MAG: YdiY family protein [Rhodospirillales bacterium]